MITIFQYRYPGLFGTRFQNNKQSIVLFRIHPLEHQIVIRTKPVRTDAGNSSVRAEHAFSRQFLQAALRSLGGYARHLQTRPGVIGCWNFTASRTIFWSYSSSAGAFSSIPVANIL
jgi:hypothetical protein